MSVGGGETSVPEEKGFIELFDKNGNTIRIPLIALHSSPLRSPRRRFFITGSPPPKHMSFRQRNYPERNKFVQFKDPGHVYYINGSKENLKSVSGIIDTIAIPSTFDEDWRSNSILSKPEYKEGKSPYSGMTAKEIREVWQKKRDDAALHGSKVHDAADKYVELEELGQDTSSIEYLHAAFVAFRRHHPELKIYWSEEIVYDDMLRICGRIDQLYEMTIEMTTATSLMDLRASTNRTFVTKKVFVDIKTNSGPIYQKPAKVGPDGNTLEYNDTMDQEDIEELAGYIFYKNRFHHSVVGLVLKYGVKFAKYIVQQNLYRELMFKKNGIKADEMYLLHIPDRDLASEVYNLIPVPYFDVCPILMTRNIEVCYLSGY